MISRGVKFHVRSIILHLVPDRYVAWLRRSLRAWRQLQFASQPLVDIQCGAFRLACPKRHILRQLSRTQPLRDKCIGIVASFVGGKYPDAAIIDIGANIGDTAAIIATSARNRLILVEPSPYYFRILSANAMRLPNHVSLRNALVADGLPRSGNLHHWGGTAVFNGEAASGEEHSTVRLCQLTDDPVCFVKIDTDGFDFGIVADSLDWLARTRPALLFEVQIRTRVDWSSATNLTHRLNSVGYRHFVIWDDAGRHLVSTSSLDIVGQLNAYLLRTWLRDEPRSIYNYDLLCVHETDADVFEQVAQHYVEPAC